MALESSNSVWLSTPRGSSLHKGCGDKYWLKGELALPKLEALSKRWLLSKV